MCPQLHILDFRRTSDGVTIQTIVQFNQQAPGIWYNDLNAWARTMQRLTGWLKNLKKWQKGGLIGCAGGVLFAVIIILSPTEDSLGEWLTNFHEIFFVILHVITYMLSSRVMYDYGALIVEYGGLLAIVILYGGLGAIWGKSQQINSPFWKWLITALLALFLLLFYVLHVLNLIL